MKKLPFKLRDAICRAFGGITMEEHCLTLRELGKERSNTNALYERLKRLRVSCYFATPIFGDQYTEIAEKMVTEKLSRQIAEQLLEGGFMRVEVNEKIDRPGDFQVTATVEILEVKR